MTKRYKGHVGVIILCLVVLAAAVALTFAYKAGGRTKSNTTADNSSMNCAQVVTTAVNNSDGTIRDFPTPCDVPAGWTIVKTSDPTETKSGQYADIKRVYVLNGTTYADIDVIDWLTGDAAVAAIKKDDPKCATDSDFGCQPPDGFYIRNTDKTIVQYQIDPAVSVTMQTLDKDSAGQYKFEDKITLARLVSAYAHKDDTMIHLAGVPYLLNISKGKITRIVEQYVP